QRQQVRVGADIALAADLLRGAGLAGHAVGRAAGGGAAGAARVVHGADHALLHRADMADVVGQARGRGPGHRRPGAAKTVAAVARQVRAVARAVGGDGRHALRQLQRGRDPVTLADAGDHRLARVPGLLAVLGLPRLRRDDARVLAGQVDAGGFAEAVAVHVRRQPVDAHFVGELVVVVVHRRGDRLVQVHPAGAAVGVAIAALLSGDVELAGAEHLVLRPPQAALQPGQGHERLDRRTRRPAAEHV